LLTLKIKEIGQAQNKRKRPDCTSQYKGVCRDQGKFKACIMHDGVSYNLGLFKTEIEAAIAYDSGVDRFFPGGLKNFPTAQQ
jgi:hypothetical protein